MVTLDQKNLKNSDPAHSINKQDIKKLSGSLPSCLKNMYARKQGFYTILDDHTTWQLIGAYTKEVKTKYSDIVVLGIGGSALGTGCIQQSLQHLFSTKLENSPRLYILDNIDPVLISELEQTIDYAKTLFIVISKSGTTPETMSQYFYFKNRCIRKKIPVKKHFLFITDEKKGALRAISALEKIPRFSIPDNVSGRFSVLTSVGLVPASLIGINIKKLLAGAKKIRSAFLSSDPSKNLCFQLAAIQYLFYKKGKKINVLMPYSQKLIKFTDWYRQLLAESIGKAKNDRNLLVNTGITPINALGATDQHSQTQLYNEGPNDKLIIFIKVNKNGPVIKIPAPPKEAPELSYLKGITFNQLFESELTGTAQAYTKNNRPNLTITIDQIDEQTLGELFMLFEGATALLAELLNINAYNQPGVELSKQFTQKILLTKKN